MRHEACPLLTPIQKKGHAESAIRDACRTSSGLHTLFFNCILAIFSHFFGVM